MKFIRTFSIFFAGAMIIIVAFTSVVGYQSTNNNTIHQSPLFTIRMQRVIDNANKRSIVSEYLGKGKELSLFTSLKPGFSDQVNTLMNLLRNNPILIQKLISKLLTYQPIKHILQYYGLREAMIQQACTPLQKNPEVFKKQLTKINTYVHYKEFQPLGLDTASVIGCFVTALILLPLTILLGVIIATILIVTCLNIGNCFATILQAIFNGLIQGLDLVSD